MVLPAIPVVLVLVIWPLALVVSPSVLSVSLWWLELPFQSLVVRLSLHVLLLERLVLSRLN